MENKIVTLDIETENTGYDIMEDNKRIISVQLLEGDDSKIYYDGSESNDLESAKEILRNMIEGGKSFLGFNIRGFDVRFIKKFLGVDIPPSQVIEISELPRMNSIREHFGKKRPRLVECCELLNVECLHKGLMDEQSDKFKQLPNVIEKAKEGATKWNEQLGWGYDFSYRLALDRIAGGMAIFEAFKKFVQANGDPNTVFYRYAMGDVFTEYALYLKMKQAV